MNKIVLTLMFAASVSLYACQGNEQTEEQQDQEHTEQHDSLQNSVLEEADRALGTGDTTQMPADSAGTIR